MNTEQFAQKLVELSACNEAKEWANGKTREEAYASCERGDWLLWLFAKTNPNDLQKLTLAKGHCAATILHLMKDERSVKAVQAAIDFGNGLIDKEQLAAYASAASASADAAAYAAYAAEDRKANQILTANICRKYLPLELWKTTTLPHCRKPSLFRLNKLRYGKRS